MTPEENRAGVARHWMKRAREALASARAEAAAGRFTFAVNRCYYAAFYAASAVLLTRGHHFVKHKGVRTALHQQLVRTGLLAEDWGNVYDRLFDDRLEADYGEFASFEAEDVNAKLETTTRLVEALEALLPAEPTGAH